MLSLLVSGKKPDMIFDLFVAVTDLNICADPAVFPKNCPFRRFLAVPVNRYCLWAVETS